MNASPAPEGAGALTGSCPACGGPTAIIPYRSNAMPGSPYDIVARVCVTRRMPRGWPCVWAEYVCDLPTEGEVRQ